MTDDSLRRWARRLFRGLLVQPEVVTNRLFGNAELLIHPEELELDLNVGDLLCVDWVSPHGPWDDSVMFIFDAGTLGGEKIYSLHLVDDELCQFKFCTEDEASYLLRPYVWRRLQEALKALRTGRVRYLQDGY